MLTFDLETIKFADDDSFDFRGRNALNLNKLDLDLNRLCYFASHKFCPSDENYFECRSNLIHTRMDSLSDYLFDCVVCLHTVLKPFFTCSRSLRSSYYYLLEHLDFPYVFCKRTNKTDFFIVFLYAYYCSVLFYHNPSFVICKERMIIKHNHSQRTGDSVECDLDSDLPF